MVVPLKITPLNDALTEQKLFDEYQQFFYIRKCSLASEQCKTVSQKNMRLAYGIINKEDPNSLVHIMNSIANAKYVLGRDSVNQFKENSAPLNQIITIRFQITQVWNAKAFANRYGEHALEVTMLLDTKEKVMDEYIKKIIRMKTSSRTNAAYNDNIKKIDVMISVTFARLERLVFSNSPGTLFD